jgi:hypothetical protein
MFIYAQPSSFSPEETKEKVESDIKLEQERVMSLAYIITLRLWGNDLGL